MDSTLFKKVDYSLGKLMQDIAIGSLGLPDIQRPFVWPNAKVRDLFDSMYKGYPVGYFLFWETGLDSAGSKTIGADTKQKAASLLIVDDNIAISDIPPKDYWPKYASRFSDAELKEMMHWHALPEGWQEMNYQDFLVARRPLIAKVIRQGYEILTGVGGA